MIKLYYHGSSENHGCEAIIRSTNKILNTDIKTSVIRRLKREFNNTKIITKYWIKSQVTGFIDGFIDMISCIFHTINIFHLYNRYTYDKKVLDTIKYVHHIRNNY